MKNYIFKLPTKIYFGENAAMELKDILTSYGITKVMIVTDPGIAGTESFQKLIQKLDADEVDYVLFDRAEADPSDRGR